MVHARVSENDAWAKLSVLALSSRFDGLNLKIRYSA